MENKNKNVGVGIPPKKMGGSPRKNMHGVLEKHVLQCFNVRIGKSCANNGRGTVLAGINIFQPSSPFPLQVLHVDL